MDWFYKEFGVRLKKARKSAGLTQEELGDRIGLSRVSITNIERGAQHFPAHMLLTLAKAVGQTPGDLIPIEPPIEIISPELLDDFSPTRQEWIKRIAGYIESEKPNEPNEKRRKGNSTGDTR